MFKKIISLVLALAVFASLSLCLFSCGGNNGGGNEGGGNEGGGTSGYTVTIVDQNGAPVAGAKVTLTTADGIPFFLNTDVNGKATLAGSYNGLTATLTSLPTGCESNKLNVAQSFDASGNLTITVNQRYYVIKVVDQEGNPIADVLVQMCDTAGVCKLPTTTDEEGKAYYPYQDGEFRAQLTEGAPDGYSVDDPGAYYDIVDGEVTIVVTKN